MCGIAGLIHRGATGDVGQEMTAMLQSMKHRGPDSTGYALYGRPHGHELVVRFKLAEGAEMSEGFDIHHQVKERRAGSRSRATGDAWPTTSRTSTARRSCRSASAWS